MTYILILKNFIKLFSLVTLFAGTLQLILFLIFLRIEEGSISNVLKKHILEDPRTTLKMSLPPVFLILSTELMKIAASIIPKEAKEASAFYIVGVGAFSFMILRKRFLLTQILAIIFIAFGWSKLPNVTSTASLSLFTMSSLLNENSIYGYLSILAAICCYGLCYVILESNLKLYDASLWIRGIQLNLFNVPLSLVICIVNHYMDPQQRGLFENFNIIAWFFIIFVVAAGMMELFVIKVADSMFRMISLALATMLINVLQYPFSFDSSISPVKIGCGLILAGIFLYSAVDFINPNSIENEEQNESVRDSSYVVPMKLYQSVPTVSYKVKECN